MYSGTFSVFIKDIIEMASVGGGPNILKLYQVENLSDKTHNSLYAKKKHWVSGSELAQTQINTFYNCG